MSPAEFAARMASFGQAPPKIAVAVSGGPHSLALALLAQGWRPVLALIADHGLRPESGIEAAGVRDMLAARGIEARILPLRLPTGPAMQERARNARLAALLRCCEEEKIPWLLLGHHRMDQAETVLLRAARGSGPHGLAGMPAMRQTAEALILRPLLDVSPAAMEAVCTAAGLAPVRDPSNDDAAFARVRARRALADPDGEGPRVAALVAAAAGFARRRVADETALLERLAGLDIRSDGTAQVSPAILGHDGTAHLLLARLLKVMGGRRHAPARAEVAALLEAGAGTLGGAWWRRDGWLVREPALVAPPVPAVAGAWWDGRWHLSRGHPGCMLGALGGGSARRAALPGLWRDGVLVSASSPDLHFRPLGGPLDAVFRPLPQIRHSPGANVSYVMGNPGTTPGIGNLTL